MSRELHKYTFKFLHVFILCALFLHSQAQKKYTVKDSIYVASMLEHAQLMEDNSLFDSALRISNECLNYCIGKNYLLGKAYAHNKLSDIYYQLTDFSKMAYHDSMAMHISEQLDDRFLLASSYNQLGLYFTEKGDKITASEFFNRALKMQQANNASSLSADIYNNVGYLYALQGEVDNATSYYILSLKLYEKLDDKAGQAKVIDNLSSLFYSINKFDEAISYQKKSIDIRKNTMDHYGLAIAYSNMSQMYLAVDSIDVAFSYQQLGMKNAESSGSKKLIAQAYIASGLLYSKDGNAEKSLENELKAIKLLEEIDEKGMLSRRYIAAGIAYAKTDSSTALNYFNKAIALSTELHNLENLRDVYAYMNIMYRERKDFYNAYYNYRKYISYRDSIINDGTLTKIAELQTKYETEKKDAQIIQLNNEQTIQQLELEKQKAIINGNFLQAKEKQNEIDLLIQTKELQDLRIKKQEEDISREKILAQVNEQKRKLAEQEQQIKNKQLQNEMLIRNFMIGGFIILALAGWVFFNRYQLKKQLEQKNILLKERSRISSELHDEVGSTLSSINILSHSAKNNILSDTNKSTELLEKINSNSQRMMDAMNDIVWSINPDNDNLESLLVRMKEFAAEILESKNIGYDILVDNDLLQIKLSPEIRRDIYLVFKEGINNIAKYSGASNALVKIINTKNSLSMQIKDNGCGFDINNFKQGNGLNNMRNRALQHGGEFSMTTEQGNGTTIKLSLPIA
jgi:two-component system sensor histidine kinase UhpB